MKRYYYTCPLQAAYMAKEFGMKLALRDDYSPTLLAEDDGRVIDYSLEIIDSDLRWKDGTFYYIHPDSVHLLEPQIGDAVEFDRWYWERKRHPETKDYPYQAHYGVVAKYGRDDEWLGISSAGHGWDNSKDGKWSLPFKIIQRNGKPFFWPEVEQ